MSVNDDQLLATMARQNWIILAVLVALSLFWQSSSVTLGVLAGGVLVIANYRWSGRSLSRVMNQPQAGAEKGIKGFKLNYLLRLIFVACAIYLLLVRGGVHPLALAVGLSVVVINILVVTVRRLY